MELAPINTQQATSTGTGDVKTITTPQGCTTIAICAETTAARVTFDGSAPASGNGVVIPSGSIPLLMPMRKGVAIKFASAVAGNSVVNVAAFV